MAQLTNDIGRSYDKSSSWVGHLSPDWVDAWKGTKKVKTVKEMLSNSAEIGALQFAIESTTRAVDFYFTNGDEQILIDDESAAPEDPRLQLLKESSELMKMSITDHIVDALTAIYYGWQNTVVRWERKGGRVLFADLKHIEQDTLLKWDIDEAERVNGFYQYSYIYAPLIPSERTLLYTFRRRGRMPEGNSILRSAYVSYFMLKNMQTTEAIVYEHGGGWLPVVKAPAGADLSGDENSSTDYGRVHQQIRNIRIDEQAGLILPDGWEYSNVSAGSVPDFNVPISRYKKDLLNSSLAGFVIIGQESVGARSLAETQSELFLNVVMNGVLDWFCDQFSKQLVEKTMRLNGLDPRGVKMIHSPAGGENPVRFAETLAKIAPYLTWTAQDESALREMMELPSRTPEEIEDERELRRASLPQFRPPQPDNREGDNQEDAEDDNSDDMRVQFFAAGNAPDDDDRRRFERAWQTRLSAFLNGQKRRVAKAVRGA